MYFRTKLVLARLRWKSLPALNTYYKNSTIKDKKIVLTLSQKESRYKVSLC
jgi:hypothetical protein